MNVAQTVFTLFFAIFWGTIANVWPRWKPFHWALVPKFRRTSARAALSFVLLNLLPIIFFTFILNILSASSTVKLSQGFWKLLMLTVPSIIPAIGIFGIYRIWITIVVAFPTSFYYTNAELLKISKTEPEPTIDTLKLENHSWFSNLFFGLLYLVIATLVPLFWPFTL
jgi:hypothetical protein